VFRSIVELQAAIKRFLAEANEHPRPFRWTKDPLDIIAAVKRGHQALDSPHSHVRRFKQQARKYLARLSSCSAFPLLDKAGGTIMKRRLIML
jgi:hypothetical protein